MHRFYRTTNLHCRRIDTTTTKEYSLSELVSDSLLQLHLRVAVGSLQKAGVSMTGQFSYRLLVHAVVQHGGDKVMTQGVEVVLSGESIFVIESPQVLRESVWVYRFSFVKR